MRMTPPDVAAATQSHGERALFAALRDAAPAGSWHVLHSVALAHHPTKPTSETDFVLVGDAGLFVIEVKGGGISLRDGLWSSTDAHDRSYPLRQSPFSQAQQASHALRAWLRSQLSASEFKHLLFGHGVAFPDCTFSITSPAWDQAMVMDQSFLTTANGIEYFLADFVAYWRQRTHDKHFLTPDQVERMARLLVPDFDLLNSTLSIAEAPRETIVIKQVATPRPASDAGAVRSRMIDVVRRDLIGPCGGPDEVLPDSPLRRYVSGVLYPQSRPLEPPRHANATDPERVPGTTATGDTTHEDQGDRAIESAYDHQPSSLGMSFVLQGESAIGVAVQAAIYARPAAAAAIGAAGATGGEPATAALAPSDAPPMLQPGTADVEPGEQSGPAWHRELLREPAPDQALVVRPDASGRASRLAVLGGRGELVVHWRAIPQGTLVSVTLINRRFDNAHVLTANPADCLFQVELTCQPVETNAIVAYPRVEVLSEDPEAFALELLYRRQEQFAIGHGCGVSWERDAQSSRIGAIRTATMPEYEVPGITYSRPGTEPAPSFLELSDLGGLDEPDLLDRLRAFVADYARWAASLPAAHPDIPAHLNSTRDELLSRIHDTIRRMQAGIDTLERNTPARRAFRLMNQAMLRQRLPVTFGAAPPNPALFGDERWRPFQLAFILLSVPSLTSPTDPDREIVDLLWFPTGGGKTEAYLGAIAFLLFYRRLAERDTAGGTAAIMRYTLRLLTTQQFQRAAKLITACELIRREKAFELSEHRITLGLWIGSALTPNRYREAEKKLAAFLAAKGGTNPFVLETCPWCETRLLPTGDVEAGSRLGIIATSVSFQMHCPSPRCPFHDGLPINVVDEALYDSPPSLLLATVDKFAMVTWKDEAKAFFGVRGQRPPELVIQDELHLIAGPLGSMVGLYETAVDAIIRRRGRPAKVIASTATIRGAAAQVRQLYNRAVRIFPPAGLSADDSYFARQDTSQPGRRYLGVMPVGISDTTASIRLTAALLQAPMSLPAAEREAYWTLVSYHNNLRGVGRGLSLAADDIPNQIEYLARLSGARDGTSPHQAPPHRDIADAYQELTSNIKADDLATMLSSLERTADEPGAVSLLLCTNMLSVGVDVQRLALMLVHGQPKSTAEYIQATSRVGRGDVPGLVVCLYSPLRPRDRSHFEQFTGFHDALYRAVEPTTVTPFAPPARERALHAVLVAMMRHGTGCAEAHAFPAHLPSAAEIRAFIEERVRQTDPDELESTQTQLTMLVDEWTARCHDPRDLKTLKYDSTTPRVVPVLLRRPGDDQAPGWPTPQSMRSVEAATPLRVIRSCR